MDLSKQEKLRASGAASTGYESTPAMLVFASDASGCSGPTSESYTTETGSRSLYLTGSMTGTGQGDAGGSATGSSYASGSTSGSASRTAGSAFVSISSSAFTASFSVAYVFAFAPPFAAGDG